MEEEKNPTTQEGREGKGEKLESVKKELKEIVPEEGGEKLEFLKREEIKTMKKDINALREIEAEKEKKKILELKKTRKEKSKLKPEPKPKQESGVKEKEVKIKREPEAERELEPRKKIEVEIKKETEPKTEIKSETTPETKPKEEDVFQESLIPKVPKRPHPSKKFIIRILFILVALSGVVFTYWIFNFRKITPDDTPSQKETEITPKEETVPPETTTQPEEPEFTIPSSFISSEQTINFKIIENEEIPSAIDHLKDLPENKFTRLVIENEKENRLVELEDIVQGYQIEAVPEVMKKLNLDEFNFLIYPQAQGKRAVFIIKITDKENLTEALRAWETNIIQEGLFVSNKEIETVGSSFKNHTFKEGDSIRYLTISKEDLGICYILFKDYFILSTSFESMEEIIKEMKSATDSALLNKIGQLFIVGFEGKTVTPELEQFLKKYKPGGILLLSKNVENRTQLETLIKEVQAISVRETGLPLFVAVDQEGGDVSRIEFLEEKTPQTNIKDTDGAHNVGLERGRELKALGVNLNLAPILDDMKDGDFYFERSFQKSPELAGELGKSLVLGQKEAGILTAIKHFPGYVNVPFNPETQLATISVPETSQFQKAMEADPELIMVSNAIYTDIDANLPFTFSQRGILYLKTTLDSDSLIISDDLAQNSLLNNFSLKEIVTRPIKSGVNILSFSGISISASQAIDSLLEAVKNGEVSETVIDGSVSKITQLKQNNL